MDERHNFCVRCGKKLELEPVFELESGAIVCEDCMLSQQANEESLKYTHGQPELSEQEKKWLEEENSFAKKKSGYDDKEMLDYSSAIRNWLVFGLVTLILSSVIGAISIWTTIGRYNGFFVFVGFVVMIGGIILSIMLFQFAMGYAQLIHDNRVMMHTLIELQESMNRKNEEN